MTEPDYRICAIVVTYHPTQEMADHLEKVRLQTQGLIVVDNGSGPIALTMLRETAQRHDFTLIDNGDNLGIAEALNRGILEAKRQGFTWVILFDQDSKVTDGFIRNMYMSWFEHKNRDRVCSVHPKYINPYNKAGEKFLAKDGGPVASMTSGALMPMWVFDKLGLFSSEYFIDMVDTEYCLRIRSAGYTIIESKNAELLHSAGYPKRKKFLWMTFTPSNYSCMRRYYITRNRIVLGKKYFFVFPLWILYIELDFIKDTLKCLILEDNKYKHFKIILSGIRDALFNKMGKKLNL